MSTQKRSRCIEENDDYFASSGDENDVLDNARKLEYLKSTLDPVNFHMAPPINSSEVTILQKITVYANFGVTASTKSGALIWLPQQGVNSIHRYTKQDTGSTFVWQNGTTPKLLQTLFIPVHATSDIQIKPDLGGDFTTGQLVSGVISFKSDSTSTTSTALSGTLSAGALNDTRDAPGFSQPDLVTQSITKKDGYANVRIQNGMVALLGPDIMEESRPLDWSLTYSTNRSGYARNITKGVQLASTSIVNNAAPFYGVATAQQQSYFFSPGYATLGLPNGREFEIPPLALEDVPTFLVSYSEQSNGGFIKAFHLFLQDDGAGNITVLTDEWTNGSVEPRVAAQGGPFLNVLPQNEFPMKKFETTPRRPDRALYVGTQIYVYTASTTNLSDQNVTGSLGSTSITCSSTSGLRPGLQVSITGGYTGVYVYAVITAIIDATTFTISVPLENNVAGANCSFLDDAITITNIDVIANRLYDRGTLGPVRVIRFDNVGEGQNLSISGTLWASVTANGRLAPFVSTKEMINSIDPRLLPVTSVLYNGEGEIFKRLYTGTEYENIIDNIVPRLNVQTILAQPSVKDSEAKSHMASSLFGLLKKAAAKAIRSHRHLLGEAAKHAISALVPGPTGKSIGNLVGGAVNQLAPHAADALANAAGKTEADRRMTNMLMQHQNQLMNLPNYSADQHDLHFSRGAWGQFGDGGNGGGGMYAAGMFGASDDDEEAMAAGITGFPGAMKLTDSERKDGLLGMRRKCLEWEPKPITYYDDAREYGDRTLRAEEYKRRMADCKAQYGEKAACRGPILKLMKDLKMPLAQSGFKDQREAFDSAHSRLVKEFQGFKVQQKHQFAEYIAQQASPAVRAQLEQVNSLKNDYAMDRFLTDAYVEYGDQFMGRQRAAQPAASPQRKISSKKISSQRPLHPARTGEHKATGPQQAPVFGRQLRSSAGKKPRNERDVDEDVHMDVR